VVLGTFPNLGPSKGLAVDANSTRVVFATRRLYSVPLDGSSAPLDISTPVTGGVRYFELTPDGQRVLFGPDRAGPTQLYTVPVDDSAAPVLLDSRPAIEVDDLQFTPDSAHYVYSLGRVKILAGPCDGSSPPIELAGTFTGKPVLISGGTRLVYQQGNEILSRALDGSDVPTRIDGPGPALVSTFQGGRDELVYSNTNERLLGAPYDGSGDILLEPGPARELDDYLIQAQGGVVAFARHGVWRVPALDPAGLAQLDARDEVFDLLKMSSGPTGSVLYRRGSEVQELWAARLDRSAPPVQLSPPITGTRITGAVARYEAAWPFVVYEETAPAPQVQRLLVARLDRRSPAVERVPVDVLPRPIVGEDLKTWWISGADLVFIGRLPGDTHQRLCRVPLDGALPMQPISGSYTLDRSETVRAVVPDPAATRFVFVADQLALVSVPGDGSVGPVVLATGDIGRCEVTEDGNWVVLRPRLTNSYWIVPIDGSSPARQLTPDYPANQGHVLLRDYLAYFPDSDGDRLYELRLVELATGVDRLYNEGSFYVSLFVDDDRLIGIADNGLHSVPLDLSAAPIRLDSGSSVRGRLPMADGTVLFLGDQDVPGQFELYRVPIDGSQAPTRLAATLPAGTDVSISSFFSLSANQESLIVLLEVNGQPHSLHSLPAAGGALVELGLPRAASAQGPLFFRAYAGDAVFLMDREVAGRFELYRQPLDAHLAPGDSRSKRMTLPYESAGLGRPGSRHGRGRVSSASGLCFGLPRQGGESVAGGAYPCPRSTEAPAGFRVRSDGGGRQLGVGHDAVRRDRGTADLAAEQRFEGERDLVLAG